MGVVFAQNYSLTQGEKHHSDDSQSARLRPSVQQMNRPQIEHKDNPSSTSNYEHYHFV